MRHRETEAGSLIVWLMALNLVLTLLIVWIVFTAQH
jgi:hypothetical protein